MAYRIVFENLDGSIGIVSPILTCGLTLEQIAEKDVPKSLKYQIIEAAEIPTDRTFRNAWTLQGSKKIIVDLPKAKEIHKNTLRVLRAPKLAALDVEFIRAVEAGDTAKQQVISAKKQALRDVTADAAIVAAETPEQLKGVVPDILK